MVILATMPAMSDFDSVPQQSVSPQDNKVILANMPAMSDFDTHCINSVRMLAAALPEAAKSGHPGASMGCSPMAHVLWGYIMRYSPRNPEWWNRDRFVLSNGHACPLLYSILHLTGYPLTMDDLKSFRQLNSKTPGHPESTTSGVEVSSGPLGQGIAQAVGLAMASAHYGARYNKPDIPNLFDNYTYVIVGDGCLQEGIASEACSLAGHTKLGRLIVLYDSNQITIDGRVDLAFTENVDMRFEGMGWHVTNVANGDTDPGDIIRAIEEAKMITDRPSLIIVRTTIGYGSALQGCEKTHGAPLGNDDVLQARKKFNLSDDIWSIESKVVDFYKQAGQKGDVIQNEWESKCWSLYKSKYPKEAAELQRRFDGTLPENFESYLPVFNVNSPPAATRTSSHLVLNALAAILPEILGGSADLTDSNKTSIKGENDFSYSNYIGRYIRFGVREHGMAAIVNGLHAYGGMRPFGATFFNFFGYAWGAMRLSALSNLGVLYIASHDSIELGEDGPTHQPVELLALLRATPNILPIRPADGNECCGAYTVWLKNKTRPTVLGVSRGSISHLEGTSAKEVEKGAYIIQDFDASRLNIPHVKRVILAGSGSELHICVAAKDLIENTASDMVVRIVSMPCWRLFDEQPEDYKLSVLPKPNDSLALLYCEAASLLGCERYFNISIGMTTFGASAPTAALWKHFGFTKENITSKVMAHFGR